MLLDVKLHGQDRDLCKQIKEKFNKEIPVILISANPDLLKDHKECLVVDIIEKPFDIKTVTQKINIALTDKVFLKGKMI